MANSAVKPMATRKSTASKTRQMPRLRRRAETLLAKSPAAASKTIDANPQRLVHELRVHQTELEMQNEELRRLQLDLEASRDRFAHLYDMAPVGYLTLDAEGVVREANLTAAHLLGLDRHALQKKNLSRLVAAESRDGLYLHLQRVFRTGSRETCELEVRRPDGAGFTGRLESIAAPGEPGRAAQCLVALSDVTRQRKAEGALHESQAQLAGVIRSAMDAIITVDSRQRIVLFNEAAERMFGWPAGKLMGQPLEALIPERFAQSHPEHARAFSETGVTNRMMGALGRISGRRADGEEFPIEASTSQVEANGRKLFTVILRDITERLRAEDAMRQEKEFSESLIETAPAIVLVLDPQGRIIRFNSCLTDLTGYRPEEVQGQDWFSLFLHAEDRNRIRQIFAGSLRGRRVHGNVNAIVTKVGELRQIEWHDTVLRKKDGSVIGVLAIGRDVTERLQAQEALRLSQAALADFFADAPLGLLWVGPDGGIVRVNQAQLEMFGCAEEDLFEHPISEFFADRELAGEVLNRLAKNKTLQNQTALFRTKQGSILHVLIDANGLWKQGRLVHSRWFVRDKTRQVELEREILKISEWEQQRFGQELHDDLCQQLSCIEFLACSLERDLATQSNASVRRAAEIARLVREANSRTRELSHGLAPAQLESEGLVGALEALAAQTRKVFRSDCSFHNAATVPVEDTEVRQHLYRIAQEAVSNAVKHGRASRIEISLRFSGARLVLGVRDNGVGLPKKPSRTKGIGLRVMQYRAGLISGSLAVQREPGGGTAVVCSVRMAGAARKGGKKK